MASRRLSGGGCANVEEGASALGDAFQTLARGMTYLQDALHMQEQEAERRLQEALRLKKQEAERRMHEALRLQEQKTMSALGVAVRRMEKKLQEKDNVIRALQQRLQEFEERLAAMEQGAITSQVSGKEEAFEQMEFRVQKVEASLQSAMDKFFPRLEALLPQLESTRSDAPYVSTISSVMRGVAAGALEEPSFPGEPSAATSALNARDAATASGARGVASSPGADHASSSTSTSSVRGGTAPGEAAVGGLEEECEMQRVEIRAREFSEKLDRAQASPCPLGEDLCKAARDERIIDVRRLLDAGADVNYTTEVGWTPLLYACRNTGNVEIVSLLLEGGADPNTVNVFGECALHFASLWNDHCVPLLIRAGADVDVRANANGATPLHYAAHLSNEAAALALVAGGARRDLKGWGGVCKDKTAFEIATSRALRHLLR